MTNNPTIPDLDEDTTISEFLETPPSGAEDLRKQIEDITFDAPSFPVFSQQSADEVERNMNSAIQTVETLLEGAYKQEFITPDQLSELQESLQENFSTLQDRSVFIEDLRQQFGAPILDQTDRNNLRDELLRRIGYQLNEPRDERLNIDVIIANTLDTVSYRATRDTAREFCDEFAKPRMNQPQRD
ncbi:hypothetical protein [Salinibaculum rarum]|uniref:hypothetical protein n=1 Tax=Salinibaculum rarum TaxID=3058903 RepID=UPI00265F6981|nr:hypothetical protein [Salinibaculum sp. KK48]